MNPNALLYKAKAFKFLAWRSLGVQVSGGIIAILAALGGAGLYTLIINPILSSILLFIISYQKYPQTLEMTWGIPSIRKIFKFSAYQFMFNSSTILVEISISSLSGNIWECHPWDITKNHIG